MKKIILSTVLFFPIFLFSQTDVPVPELEDEENTTLAFEVIEQIPIFPGCENAERNVALECFNKKMQKHIVVNFSYPEEARKQNIEGKVRVFFTINKVGDVVNTRVTGAHEILQTEAKRIFSLLPKMKPGIQRGKPVNVTYTIPLVFKLH